MDERIASDARFANLAKVRQARRMTPEMRFRAGSDLFEEACQWTLAGISARFHPPLRPKKSKNSANYSD
jgi:hypothetical protein